MAYSITSTASPVPSEIFALVALLVLSVGVLLILRHYLPLRTTPAYLLVPVFFALWLPAGIVLLVPIDLASNAATDDDATRGIWLPQRLLLVSWRITYWLTFALTWYAIFFLERVLPAPCRFAAAATPSLTPFFFFFRGRFILPVLAEYSDAGYREPKDRLLYSLRENAQYYAIVLGSGIVGLIYVFISYGVSFTSLKGLIMALAYCWGLMLAIYLMGHGLVAIPRRLLRSASVSGQLRRLQSQAPRLHEKLEDAEINLEDVEMQVSELSRRKTGSARDFHDWIEELVDAAGLPESHPRPGAAPGSGPESRILPTVITEKYMADLTRQLVRARQARSRYLSEWNQLLQDASETQAILNSASSKRLEFGRASPGAGFWGRLPLLTPYARHIVYYQIIPYVRMGAGGLFALASAFIIWSETVKFALPSLSVIRFTVVYHWTGDKGQVAFPGQLAAALWILYMCAAALISITEVKVWRGRALVKRNTAHESAFWYASQVARLSVPLSYNFVTFLPEAVYKKTVFYGFLGQLINLTPLGEWFDYLFPIFILVPVCATLFGLYGKIKRFFGFGDIVDDDEDDPDRESGYGTGSWREGRDLIERELNGTSIRQGRREGASSSGATDGAGRAAPVMVVPGSRRNNNNNNSNERTTSTTPFATSPSNPGASSAAASPPSRRTLGQSSRRPELTEPEDENFFQSLGHRMKNTIDTMDTPKWFQEIGQGMKKPKWMGSNDDENARPSSGGGFDNPAEGVRRWFGGGGGGSSGQGRIRL